MATHILLKNNTMPTDNRPTLAIDTSTSFLSIALEHQGEIRLFHENVGTKQSEQILPQIERLEEAKGESLTAQYRRFDAELKHRLQTASWYKHLRRCGKPIIKV